MRKKIISALALSLLISASTSGYTSEPIKPIQKDHFKPVSLSQLQASYPPKIIEGKTNKVETKPRVIQIEPRAKAITKAPRAPKVSLTGRRIKGLASWYCSNTSPCRVGFPPGSKVAAAGPALRAAIGGSQSSPAYRNKSVIVCGSKGCMNIKLVDWCQCYYKQPNEKLIDLYKVVWDAIGASKGKVTVSW